MLKKFAFLSLIVCAALNFAGCPQEDEETAENDMTMTSNGTTDMTTGGTTSESNDPGPTPGAYRYVILEDDTETVSGDFPGADVDAISVTKGDDAVEYFATTVEDFNIGALDSNTAIDTEQLLGPSDADCTADSGKFTALGGSADDSYVIVGFSTEDEEVTFDSGDTIKIYELGSTLCNMFDDDPYTVSVSASDDRGNAVSVGTQSEGVNAFVIP